MDYALIGISVLPVILLGIYVYLKDKYEKEPFGVLLKAFLGGILAVPIAILMETWLTSYIGGGPVLQGIYNGYVVAGFSEEFCKLAILTAFIWRNRHFNEYFDGIVYAAFTGLGFACVENIAYVLASPSFEAGLTTGIVRALLSVPGHFLFAVVMGYYFARAKFDRRHRLRKLFKALFYPLLLHGTFDALLMVSENLSGTDWYYAAAGVLMIAFICFDLRLWKKCVWKIRYMQERSRMQQIDDTFRPKA